MIKEQKVCILVNKSKQDKFGFMKGGFTQKRFLWHLADLAYCSYYKLQDVCEMLRLQEDTWGKIAWNYCNALKCWLQIKFWSS